MNDSTGGTTKTAIRSRHRAGPAARPPRSPGRLPGPGRVGVLLGIVLGAAALTGAAMATQPGPLASATGTAVP
jgi:hypothetical protein